MRFIHKVFLFIFISLISTLFSTGNTVFALSNSCINSDSSDFTYHVNNQIDSRLKLSDSNSGLSLYTDRPASLGANWTRNSSSWTQKNTPIDFTGIMGSNDDLAHHANNIYQGGAALITPRHFITANHFRFEKGTTMNFYTSSGALVSRKMVDSYTIPSTDITIGLLDSDVDSTISYYPIIKSSVFNSLILKPNNYYYIDLPIVVFNQYGQALVRSLIKKDIPNVIDHLQYISGLRSDYSKNLITGDSGQPAFIIVNNKPILMFANFYTEESPNLGDYISEINSAISSLGNSNGYKVTEFNPSGFNIYDSFCTGSVLPKPSQLNLNTKSTCLSESELPKVTVSWSGPSNYSLVPGYEYRLSIDGAGQISFPQSTNTYTDTNIKPDTSHSYNLKLYFGSYSSDSLSSNVQIPKICSVTQPVSNPNPQTTITPVVEKTQSVVAPVQPVIKVSDVDGDGISDTVDLCPGTPSTYYKYVNNKGCIKPNINNLTLSTDISDRDLFNMSNLSISNIWGKISFINNVNLTRFSSRIDIDSNVYISNRVISINSNAIPEFNKQATLTFNNINLIKPVIYRDDKICSGCEIISYSNNILKVQVPGFSTYSVIEGYIEAPKVELIQPIQTIREVEPAEVTYQPIQPVREVEPISKAVQQQVEIESVPVLSDKNIDKAIKKDIKVEIKDDINEDIKFDGNVTDDISIPKFEKQSYVKVFVEYVTNKASDIISRVMSGFREFLNKI